MNFSKSITVLVLTLFLSVGAFAQSTEFMTTQNLGFKESSKTKNIKVKVTESTSLLNLNIKCGLREGTVTIEIFDPSGEKQGEFSVESIETEDDGSLFNMLQKGVEGQINKLIDKPKKGIWSIKFTPKNASGGVEIQSVQQM